MSGWQANSGPIDWPLPALCRVPLAVEGNLLGSRPGTRRGARALAVRALRHRVAAKRQGLLEAHRQAAAYCAGALWGRKWASWVAGRTEAMCQHAIPSGQAASAEWGAEHLRRF